MKKTLAVLLAATMLLLPACGKKEEANTIRDDKSLSEVMDAVSAAYSEKYGEDVPIVMMPMEVDTQMLGDMCQLASEDVAETYGWIAASMTNSDAFFAVKAAEGKIDVVTEALAARIEALIAQYEFYPVNGSYDRAKAGKVYVKGDYAFLIAVGTASEDPSTYEQEVQFVMDTIDTMFY